MKTKKKGLSSETYSDNETTNIEPNNFSFSDTEKPLRADAKQNREQILQTACKAFAEKGLAVPISEIASEAGIGIGTVYRHFPTKEALFDAIIISYKQKLTEKAKVLINDNDPGKAFFNFFSIIMEDGFTNRAVADAFRIGIFRVRVATSGVMLDFQSAFAELLARAQQAKAVREDVDVMDLIAIMSGVLVAVDEHEGTPNRSRFEKVLAIVFDGLRYKNSNV